MKKVLFVITIMVMVLAVVPQVMAQDVQTLERLLADYMAGRITEAEFNRRVQEFEGGLAEQEDQERQQQQQQDQARRAEYLREYTGSNRNWPAARVYSQFNVGTLRQPRGTTASYSTDTDRNANGINIYIHNSSANTVQELKTQIETATKRTMVRDGNETSLTIDNYFPNTRQSNLSVRIIEREYGVVTIRIASYTEG